jgi:hypothetical protein
MAEAKTGQQFSIQIVFLWETLRLSIPANQGIGELLRFSSISLAIIILQNESRGTSLLHFFCREFGRRRLET